MFAIPAAAGRSRESDSAAKTGAISGKLSRASSKNDKSAAHPEKRYSLIYQTKKLVPYQPERFNSRRASVSAATS